MSNQDPCGRDLLNADYAAIGSIQYNIIQYNFIAKWQMHKECVMVPSTLIHTVTHTQKTITVKTLK